MSAPYWAHVEPFWCILWFVLAFVGQEFLAMLGHFGPRWHHIWLMLSHFSGILWFLLALVGQELGPYWAYLGPFVAMLGHFWQSWHHIAAHLGPFWAAFGSSVGLAADLACSVVEFSSMQQRLQKMP